MCRSSEFEIQGSRTRSLKIKAFLLHLDVSEGGDGVEQAEWLTLVLLPRINGSPLDVNGSKIPADCPAFITLHRVGVRFRAEAEADNKKEVVFASSRDRVRGREGLSFEVHVGQHRLLRGIFRAADADADKCWKMECKCIVKPEIVGLLRVREADLSVVLSLEQQRAEDLILRETVATDINNYNNCTEKWRRWRRRRCRAFQVSLEEIPEVDEEEEEEEEDHLWAPQSQFPRGWNAVDGNWDGNEQERDDLDFDALPQAQHLAFAMDMDMPPLQHYKWAVDVSFWAFCFGLGFFVSRASAKRLRLSKFLPL